MITLETAERFVNVAVLGEFTLADYKEFEEQVLYQLRFHGKPALLFDLRDMLGYTLDVAWEEMRFSREHAHDFGRIAVVSTDESVVWATWISKFFVDADVQVFDDYDAAREWLLPPEQA